MNKLFLLALSIVPWPLLGQSPQYSTTVFRISVEAATGYYYKTNVNRLAPESAQRGGIGVMTRLRWGSSNLFSIGMETGWFPVSSTDHTAAAPGFGSVHVAASSDAIPLLLLVSMQRFGIQLHLGAGYYNLGTRINVDEEISESREWDFGLTAGIGALFPLSEKCRVGGEIAWNNISEQQISVVSVRARILYRIFEW